MSMYQKLTIREIAERTGLSAATVSRALSGKSSVSEKTKRKITAVTESGNEPAERKGRGSRIILASFPDMVNPFSSALTRGISDTAARRGYSVVFYDSSTRSAGDNYDFLEKASFCDGILLAHTLPDPERLNRLAGIKPVVMCAEQTADSEVPFVAIDDYAAAKTAVNHLLAIGKKNIAMINSSLSNNYAVHRERAYRDCLAAAGLPVEESRILHLTDMNTDSALGIVPALFGGDNVPDAVFCAADIFAAAVVKYASVHGIRVPEELSVMGFDDIPLASAVIPSLSTIRQPIYQIGAQACGMLLNELENPGITVGNVLLSTELVVRDSTYRFVHV